jgi:hypothetical protein
LRERGTGIDSECTDSIDESIGEVQARTIGTEHQVLTVEPGLEFADHRVVAGIDDAREIGVLIGNDVIGPRKDRRI